MPKHSTSSTTTTPATTLPPGVICPVEFTPLRVLLAVSRWNSDRQRHCRHHGEPIAAQRHAHNVHLLDKQICRRMGLTE